MSIPKFRAFKFNPIKINDKKFVPVVVETSQAQHTAKPPYVIFSDWFDKVISLTPSPHSEIMISTTKPKGNEYNKGYFSSGLSAPKSYACGFINEEQAPYVEIKGVYADENNKQQEASITIEDNCNEDDVVNHYEQAINLAYEKLDDKQKTVFLSENLDLSRNLKALLSTNRVAFTKPNPEFINLKLSLNTEPLKCVEIQLEPGVPINISRADLKKLFNYSVYVPSDYLQICYLNGEFFIRNISNLGTNLYHADDKITLHQGIWQKFNLNSSINTTLIPSLMVTAKSIPENK